MSLIITIIAYLLNGISVTVDKFLLSKSVPNPLTYVFYINLFSMVALILIPFGQIPDTSLFILISLSTLIWTIAAIFMFKALKVGVVSRVIPVIGTLTPLFLLFYSTNAGNINLDQTWALALLISGLVFMTLTDWKGHFHAKEFLFELLSSLFFAIYYLVLKESFTRSDFLSVLSWSRVILIPIIILILIIPALKKKILRSRENPSKPGLLFLSGQIAGGASGALLNYAVSLTNPAFVSSLQGIQYVFLFIFSILLFKRFPKIFFIRFSLFNILTKISGLLLIFIGLFILAFSQTKVKKPDYGITFSPRYAYQLGLEPKSTYINMLDSLKVKTIRLPLYWDELETFPMQFNFSKADFYLGEAQKRNVKVILVLGIKQPRWPECFAPIWIKNMTTDDKRKKILNLVELEVNHFKNFENVSTWQLENEPFLNFGSCAFSDGLPDGELITQEIEIVKNLDKRPILITDSGELGWWLKPIQKGGIFGTTLYRQVWNPFFGSFNYPFPPVFYKFKDFLARKITGKSGTTIISELQGEPWITDSKIPPDISLREQLKLFPVSQLGENIDFANQTGFGQTILWGVEWWYYMAKNNHPEYLNFFKDLLSNT